MDSLQHLIKSLYGEIADNEAILAENNLLGFFRRLEVIDERLLQESLERSNQIGKE
jgi:hypothetical protein